MVFLEQLAHGEIRRRAETSDADFPPLQILNARDRRVGHDVECNRIADRANRHQVAAPEIGIDNHLTVGGREISMLPETCA